MTKHITIELTEHQAQTLVSTLDYSKKDGEGYEQNNAFIERIKRKIIAELVK